LDYWDAMRAPDTGLNTEHDVKFSRR